MHFFVENNENEHLIFCEFHRSNILLKKGTQMINNRICNFILLLIVLVCSFSKMLPYLKFIGERVVDFLLVLIELFH